MEFDRDYENRLQVKLLSHDATIPTRAHSSDAGLDLYASAPVRLYKNEVRRVATHVAVSIPDGYTGLVCPRSGLATKGVTVHNAPGVIDTGFTGGIEVIMIFQSNDHDWYEIRKGDKIAQLVIVPVWLPSVQIVDDLGASERGTNGIGSTGK